jgi:hypothetical protein
MYYPAQTISGLLGTTNPHVGYVASVGYFGDVVHPYNIDGTMWGVEDSKWTYDLDKSNGSADQQNNYAVTRLVEPDLATAAVHIDSTSYYHQNRVYLDYTFAGVRQSRDAPSTESFRLTTGTVSHDYLWSAPGYPSSYNRYNNEWAGPVQYGPHYLNSDDSVGMTTNFSRHGSSTADKSNGNINWFVSADGVENNIPFIFKSAGNNLREPESSNSTIANTKNDIDTLDFILIAFTDIINLGKFLEKDGKSTQEGLRNSAQLHAWMDEAGVQLLVERLQTHKNATLRKKALILGRILSIS